MRLVVAVLDIPVEYIDVHLKDKPVWYIPKINPHGQVPVVEHEGKLIRESIIGFGECVSACVHMCICLSLCITLYGVSVPGKQRSFCFTLKALTQGLRAINSN